MCAFNQVMISQIIIIVIIISNVLFIVAPVLQMLGGGVAVASAFCVFSLHRSCLKSLLLLLLLALVVGLLQLALLLCNREQEEV